MNDPTFKISNQINIEEINKVYGEKFENIIFEFVNLEIQWLQNAYNEYKDLDKYLILIKLIHKTLLTYNKHFYKMNFYDFYNSYNIEIEKISIVELVKELNISKETLRRKLNELSKDGIIVRRKKKIKLTYVSANKKLKKNVNNLARLLYIFTKNLGKEFKLSTLSREEINKKILINYTQYWNLFFNFQIPYILRWKKICKSSENFYIFALCAYNEIVNSKNISKINNNNIFENLETLHGNISETQKKTKGLNPTTIAELSGIPRATVIRKINYLFKKDLIIRNKKNNLYSLNNDKNSASFLIQSAMFKQNQKELRNFVIEILNLIRN